jgi:hypothetical protein
MPLSTSDRKVRFKELCDRLKRNDPTLTKINDTFLFPPHGYAQRLGAALQRNTSVTELSLCWSGLLCPRHVKTFQTHKATLLLQFIRVSPSLRKMQLFNNISRVNDTLTQLILEAMLHNPGISSLDMGTWRPSVLNFLEARPMLVSLNIKLPYGSAEEFHAAGCAIAVLPRLETLELRVYQHLGWFLQPLVGHCTLHRLCIQHVGHHYGMKEEVNSLGAVLRKNTQLRYLVLRNLCVDNTQWKIIAQGFQSRASSCAILPLQSVTFEECGFAEEAYVAIFSSSVSSSSTAGGQL